MKISLKFGSIGAAALLGCATCMATGTASATSCLGNDFPAPADGATNVPTNTLIWAHGRFGTGEPARLLGPDGEVPTVERFVPVSIGPAQGTNFPVLIPESELQPNALYRIDHEGEFVTFETGSGPSTAAPALPQLTSSAPGAGYDSFSGFVERYVTLSFAHRGILIGDTGGALGAPASVADLLLPPEAGFTGIAVSASSKIVRWATTSSQLHAGVGACMSWPEINVDRQTARFGVLDLAGNFSGWTELVVEIPSPAAADEMVATQRAAAESESSATSGDGEENAPNNVFGANAFDNPAMAPDVDEPTADLPSAPSAMHREGGCALPSRPGRAKPIGSLLVLGALLGLARRRPPRREVLTPQVSRTVS